MTTARNSVWRRVWSVFSAGDPETGWLGRLVGTGVITGLLITTHVSPGAWWVWVCLGCAFAGWLFYVIADPRVRVLPLVGLAVAALAGAVTLAADGDTTGIVISYLCLTMFATHRAVRPLASTALAVVIAAALIVIWPWTGRSLEALLLLIGLLAFIVLSCLYRRQYHQRAAETAELLQQTRLAQAEQARAAALDERARIARELHDVLAHSLGALGVQLEVAEAMLEESDLDGGLARVRRARRLAAEGLGEARSAVAALRSDPMPLPEALSTLATAHGRDHHAAVPDIEVRGASRPVPAAVAVSLAGAAREALTNAARHAPGAPVRIVLEYEPERVRLAVRNGAPAREPEPRSEPSGNGLTGMRERLALVGGQLSAGADGDGWHVVAEVPE
ncbi:sensor histidine kinase [Pseudonocardia sp. TRM90224]|uniref:sensor histidine kinase n=1 Tax=Pseudonocardia sp. TRM90224 TaxID=2812678 RepID=UPI001E3DD347|nr:histidine kinase [Pseudonocardia sp. TRM90224]